MNTFFDFFLILLIIIWVVMTVVNFIMMIDDKFDKVIYKYRYKLPIWFVGNESLMTCTLYIGALLPIINLVMPAIYLCDEYEYMCECMKVHMTDQTTYHIDDKGNINLFMRYSDGKGRNMHIFNDNGALKISIDFGYVNLSSEMAYAVEIVFNSLKALFPGYKYLRINGTVYEMLHADMSKCNLNAIRNILDANNICH